ncbi:peroxin, partial [Tulasnella sp. 427]
LRNRFLRNQEDCIFTSQALVPAFGNQILEQLDVEALTLDIQYYGKPRPQPSAPEPSTPPSALRTRALSPESSVPAGSPVSAQDTHTDSSLVLPDHSRDVTAESWVKEFSASQMGVPPQDLPLPPPRPHELSPPISAAVSPSLQPLVIAPNELGLSESEAGDPMASSVYSESSISPEAIVHILEPSSILQVQSGPSIETSTISVPPVPTKTKTELWKELRVMTFTRTLTILYTLTLLTLQTHVQLNLLASFKYVQSVYEMEAEQKERERQEGWWGSIKSPMDKLLGSGNASSSSLLSRLEWDEIEARVVKVTELSERKYITISWWLLNVGWKEIKDKVEAAVAEVFGRVPLKSELTVEALRQRINEVRMKVEHSAPTNKEPDFSDELTESEQQKLQGVHAPLSTTQRTEWESVLIPLTNASEQQTLLSGGLSPEHVLSSLRDTAFRTLMDDTRVLLNGQDFGVVFDKAMDWSVDWLVERVQRDVFECTPEEQKEGEQDEEGKDREEKKVKLAALLPGVARLSHTLVNSMPNELIEGMSQLPEMSAFSAIIFASYEERLRPQDEI